MNARGEQQGDGIPEAISLDFADPEARRCGLVEVALGAGRRALRGFGAVLGKGGPELSLGLDADLERPAEWSGIEAGGAAIGDDGERATVQLDDDGRRLRIGARRAHRAALGNESAFAKASALSLEACSAQVEAEWRPGAPGRERAAGRLLRRRGRPDWGAIELVRVLAATLEDDSVLLVCAARPRGAAGHGEEATDAVLVGPEGSTRFAEPLISTEYDPAGLPRRAGVELWESSDADARPLRGAGDRIAATSATAQGSRVETVFMGWSLDGAPGTARYELMRPA